MTAFDPAASTRVGRRLDLRGTVQGVGFRPWVYRLARDAGLTGRVRNGSEGVTIEAFGPEEALDRFARRLRHDLPPAAFVDTLDWTPIPLEPAGDFVIARSDPGGERRVSIPPDLATCAECAAEIADPADRRHRYPFTNCTACGPRFTIARAVPYDRATTTMAAFEMCGACRREYEHPDDRRFHAEPNACPACGPRLVALDSQGAPADAGDPIGAAAAALREGRIVALKGIGGFHLACDATSAVAVRRLRERKRRDEKPFAVMVRDLAAARHAAHVGPAERRLLESVERPIVLLERRSDAPLCDEVAPGNPLVGLFLPYSPLHHLLLADAGLPLVMTSGNLAGEPIAWRNGDAVQHLAGVADLFLVHDRDIETPCDDSVARVIAGSPVFLRRARGGVPRPQRLRHPVGRPVLACGAALKNTFCFAIGSEAYLGPHIGDLEGLETCRAYEAAIDRMQRFLGVDVEVIAHDLHPDYLSTRYALDRPAASHVGVQHHHAHVASAMAEHGLQGPVLGVAYDGTGYGLDGTAWGAEVLLASMRGFERVATFRAIPLAGGDTAIREPWRIALALADEAFDGEAPIDRLPLFRALAPGRIATVRRMIAARVASPLASGMGRYFDGLGALGLGRARATYEGQVALEWNLAADPAVDDAYPFALDTASRPWTADLRPTVRHAIDDLVAGRPAALVSARFHNTIADATAEIVRLALGEISHLPVVLTGGCFQNARLAEGVLTRLAPVARVFTHSMVPPGDGGISLGQAVVAAAQEGR
jgi:hydrogenase maturation protein HypF